MPRENAPEPERGNIFPPFVKVEPNALGDEARDCFQAAMLRNIYQHEELKSLIYVRSGLSNGSANVKTKYVMVHVPGDLYVDQGALRDVVGECHLAKDYELKAVKLEPGRVNPWTEKKYLGGDVTHVVSPLVVVLNEVFTNDDTLTGTSKFNPRELLQMLDPVIWKFEIATNTLPKRQA